MIQLKINAAFGIILIISILHQALTGICPCHSWKPEFEAKKFNCQDRNWNISIRPFRPEDARLCIGTKNAFSKKLEKCDEPWRLDPIPPDTETLFMKILCYGYGDEELCQSKEYKLDLAELQERNHCPSVASTTQSPYHPTVPITSEPVHNQNLSTYVIVISLGIILLVIIFGVLILQYTKKRKEFAVQSSSDSSTENQEQSMSSTNHNQDEDSLCPEDFPVSTNHNQDEDSLCREDFPVSTNYNSEEDSLCPEDFPASLTKCWSCITVEVGTIESEGQSLMTNVTQPHTEGKKSHETDSLIAECNTLRSCNIKPSTITRLLEPVPYTDSGYEHSENQSYELQVFASQCDSGLGHSLPPRTDFSPRGFTSSRYSDSGQYSISPTIDYLPRVLKQCCLCDSGLGHSLPPRTDFSPRGFTSSRYSDSGQYSTSPSIDYLPRGPKQCRLGHSISPSLKYLSLGPMRYRHGESGTSCPVSCLNDMPDGCASRHEHLLGNVQENVPPYLAMAHNFDKSLSELQQLGAHLQLPILEIPKKELPGPMIPIPDNI
ncbi:uncharacterized protein LOC106056559 [Biomphalaria glabrata]|uniref:Uncharacterized protein LOC106056559 n=1 Tax=Biomphalaria glabrata TaxID=6526 RepID=A0A9W3A394_BIOGL|nr:uncharacterized protein LOC106056559 [Biomphalaria glabrata]